MATEQRLILLFIDNCTAHPDVVRSNVKLMSLTPNTTSKLQPLDAGIIQNVKMYYRKQFLRHVLGHVDEASYASELATKVNIFNAIMWLKSAWDAVTPETIEKCLQSVELWTPWLMGLLIRRMMTMMTMMRQSH